MTVKHPIQRVEDLVVRFGEPALAINIRAKRSKPNVGRSFDFVRGFSTYQSGVPESPKPAFEGARL